MAGSPRLLRFGSRNPRVLSAASLLAYVVDCNQLVGRLRGDWFWWWGDPRPRGCPWPPPGQDPLRPLRGEGRRALPRLRRSLSAPAAQVERARARWAIAEGASYT